MALAQQVAANQPVPLSSSPARLPWLASNVKLLLLVQPAPFLGGGRSIRLLHGARRTATAAVVRASSSAQAEPKSEGGEGGDKAAEEERPYEEYEVTIEKPYGLKFSKGRDGGTYVEAILPGAAADQTGQFTVGDKMFILLTMMMASPSSERISGRRQGTARPCTPSVRGSGLST